MSLLDKPAFSIMEWVDWVELRRLYYLAALRRCDFKIPAAAKLLGIETNTLKRWCQQYRIRVVASIPDERTLKVLDDQIRIQHRRKYVERKPKPKESYVQQHRLPPDDVREIRKLLAEGKFSGREIAGFFGVSPHCITAIKQGKTYKHVE